MVALTQTAFAQHVALDPLEIRSSGKAYTKAVRFRGIDRNVLYFDPTQPPPPFETSQSLRTERQADANGPNAEITVTGGRVVFLLIASMVLLGIVYLFIRFGGRLPVSFASKPEDGAGQRLKQRNNATSDTQVPLGIDAALQIADRREALVALCKILLARVMTSEGVLLQDSWTDRDKLRRVPDSLPLRDALQSLVYASERVQFGGRDVTEEEFVDHIEHLKPLWVAGSS